MKFKSFYEMLKFNADNFSESIALNFEEDNKIKNITYKMLFQKVIDKAKLFDKDKNYCYGIFKSYNKEWIIDFFASVISGKQTVLIDSSLNNETLQKLVIYADVNKLLVDKTTDDVNNFIKLSDKKIKKAKNEGNILFFTSGTTGVSKAVVLTSKNLCASAWNGQDKLPCLKTDTLLALLPFTHVFGFVCCLMWPMSVGATVALGRGLRFLDKDCKFFKPNIISVVPSILYFLLAKNALNEELRIILVGAGPANENALQKAKSLGYDVHFGYGLTETSSGVAISTGENPFLMEVCHDDIVTLAKDGEILVRCPECMMKSYYKLENETLEVLKDGLLKTGDIGRVEKGYLKIVGRKKDILVLENGTKIYLPEWEHELLDILKVDDLAITMRDNVVTAICVDENDSFSMDGLNELLTKFNRLKPFDKQVTKIEKTKNKLPKTAIGKIKRWEL